MICFSVVLIPGLNFSYSYSFLLESPHLVISPNLVVVIVFFTRIPSHLVSFSRISPNLDVVIVFLEIPSIYL